MEEPKLADKMYRNITYLSDVTGTGFWRHIAPITTANCIQPLTGVVNLYTQPPICDPNYYVGVNAITIQRWLTPEQRNFVEKFLLPVSRRTGSWLIYEIDDAMGADDIPKYNRGHLAFQNQETQDNIKYMLNVSDLVVVTTHHIKEYYHNKYGVPMEKLVAVPNLLPRWWYGDRYDPLKKLEQFRHFKSRPRVGLISSLSHYNIMNQLDENGNVVKDDFDVIADVVRQTADDFQWIVVGYAPPQIKDLVESKKVLCCECLPILSYPSAIEQLQLQAVVAPLQDNEFNRCKSSIKYMECCASGIPLFASNILPYKGVMPEKQLFSTQEELKDKLMELKFCSNGAYGKCIEAQWKWLNSPRIDGDFKLNSSWMEENLGVWMSLYQLNNKLPQHEEKKDETKDKQELH